MKTYHIVSVSGGASSSATLIRVVERYPKNTIIPIFADTHWEHPDLYRFLDDLESYIGIPIIRLSQGKTPADVSEDDNFIYNSRVANCTKKLKIYPIQRYIKKLKPKKNRVFLHIGFNIDDRFKKRGKYGRLPSPVKNWRKKHVIVKYPLWFYPRILDPHQYLESLGFRLPELYLKKRETSLPISNNCSSGCFKQGIKTWFSLAMVDPEIFKKRMLWEKYMREEKGLDKYAICTRVVNGEKIPYTLEEIWYDYQQGDIPKRLKLALMESDIENDCSTECQVF